MDPNGDVLYSDENANQLGRIRLNGTSTNATEILYDSASVGEVSRCLESG